MTHEITISVHIPDDLVNLAKALGIAKAEGVAPVPVEVEAAPAPRAETPVVASEQVAAEPGVVTVADAKAAVVAWAEKNGGPPVAVAELQKNFGVKLKEIGEEQAAAIHAFFTKGAA